MIRGAVVATAIVLAASPDAIAQPQTTSASQVLANVEATYKKSAQLSAGFKQTLVNPIGGTKKTAGTLYVVKPDKLRFDYGNSKNFIFDGATLWAVEHENTQIFKQTTKSSSLPAALKFFTGAGSLATEFNVGFPRSPDQLIPGATVLELTPKKPSAESAHVYLVVDPTTWTVARTTVVNSSGVESTFELGNVDTKKPIDSKVFRFDPKKLPGYKLIDGSAPAPKQ